MFGLILATPILVVGAAVPTYLLVRHVLKVASGVWIGAFICTSLAVNAVLFFPTFIIAGDFGAGMGAELSQAVGIRPKIAPLIGAVLSITIACSIISMGVTFLVVNPLRKVVGYIQSRFEINGASRRLAVPQQPRGDQRRP